MMGIWCGVWSLPENQSIEDFVARFDITDGEGNVVGNHLGLPPSQWMPLSRPAGGRRLVQTVTTLTKAEAEAMAQPGDTFRVEQWQSFDGVPVDTGQTDPETGDPVFTLWPQVEALLPPGQRQQYLTEILDEEGNPTGQFAGMGMWSGQFPWVDSETPV